MRDLVSRQLLLDPHVEPRLLIVHDPFHKQDAEHISSLEVAFEAARKRLLIVGEPASGKTIAAYRLTRLLAADRNCVPLVVNLSSWAGQPSFEQFLVDYLCNRTIGYGIKRRRAARAWLEQGGYGLVLDGLDEVMPDWRGSLLSKLDSWLPEDTAIVLTSRTREYCDLLRDRARGIGLALAVEMQPLDDEQLDAAFAEIAKTDASWNDLIGRWRTGQRHAARKALRSPLLLNFAVSTGVSAHRLRESGAEGASAVRLRIIDEYLDDAFRDDPPLASWARWIAMYLTGKRLGPFGSASSDQTVFELARTTPFVPPPEWHISASVSLALLPLILTGTIEVILSLPSRSLNLILMYLFLMVPIALSLRHQTELWDPESVLDPAIVSDVGGESIDAPYRRYRNLSLISGLVGSMAGAASAYTTAKTIEGQLALQRFLDQLALSQWDATLAAVAFPLAFGALYALEGGGWFLVMQRLGWHKLYVSHGLSRNPRKVLPRGIRSEKVALPLLREVGSGVRFIHNDVRDRLAATGPDE